MTHAYVCVYIGFVPAPGCPREGLMKTSNGNLEILVYNSETWAKARPKENSQNKGLLRMRKG